MQRSRASSSKAALEHRQPWETLPTLGPTRITRTKTTTTRMSSKSFEENETTTDK